LCVALNVEIHNHLFGWSAKQAPDGKAPATRASAPPLATLKAELRAQQEQVQGVFGNFRRAGAPATPVPQAQRKAKAKKPKARTEVHTLVPLLGAALFLVGAFVANLYATGIVHVHTAPTPLPESQLLSLSPLLLRASLNPEHKQLQGLLSRPAWLRMDARQRQQSAALIADKLKLLGVDHAELYAYKTRAIAIDFGSVVYLDESR
jgi:hypothetical protein